MKRFKGGWVCSWDCVSASLYHYSKDFFKWKIAVQMPFLLDIWFARIVGVLRLQYPAPSHVLKLHRRKAYSQWVMQLSFFLLLHTLSSTRYINRQPYKVPQNRVWTRMFTLVNEVKKCSLWTETLLYKGLKKDFYLAHDWMIKVYTVNKVNKFINNGTHKLIQTYSSKKHTASKAMFFFSVFGLIALFQI